MAGADKKKILLIGGGAFLFCVIVMSCIALLIYYLNQEEDTTTTTSSSTSSTTSTAIVKNSTNVSTSTSTSTTVIVKNLGRFLLSGVSTQGFTIILDPNIISSGINQDDIVNISVSPTPTYISIPDNIKFGILNGITVVGNFNSGIEYTVNINIGSLYSTPQKFTPLANSKNLGSFSVDYVYISSTISSFVIKNVQGYSGMLSNDNITINMYKPDNTQVSITPTSVNWGNINNTSVQTTQGLSPNIDYKFVISCCNGSQSFNYCHIKSLGTFNIVSETINGFNIQLNSDSYGMNPNDIITISIIPTITFTTVPLQLTWSSLQNARINGNITSGINYSVSLKSTNLRDSSSKNLYIDATNNFIIKSKTNSGKCFADNMSAQTCVSSNDQQWTYDDNKKQIKNLQGYCLELRDGSNNNNTDVLLTTCVDGYNKQKWTYDTNTKQLKNYMGNTCLDLYNSIGPRVSNWGCHTGLTISSNDNQQWDIIPVGSAIPKSSLGTPIVSTITKQYGISPILEITGFSNVKSLSFNSQGTLGVVDGETIQFLAMTNADPIYSRSSPSYYVWYRPNNNPSFILGSKVSYNFYVALYDSGIFNNVLFHDKVRMHTNINSTNITGTGLEENSLSFPYMIDFNPRGDLIAMIPSSWTDSTKTQMGVTRHMYFLYTNTSLTAVQIKSIYDLPGAGTSRYTFLKYNKQGDKLFVLQKKDNKYWLLDTTPTQNISNDTPRNLVPSPTVLSSGTTSYPDPECINFGSGDNFAISYVPDNGTGYVQIQNHLGGTNFSTPIEFNNVSNGINKPVFVIFDSNDNLIIANYGGNNVFVYYSPNYLEIEKTILSTGINKPITLDINPVNGNLAVGCYGNNKVLLFNYQ